MSQVSVLSRMVKFYSIYVELPSALTDTLSDCAAVQAALICINTHNSVCLSLKLNCPNQWYLLRLQRNGRQHDDRRYPCQFLPGHHKGLHRHVSEDAKLFICLFVTKLSEPGAANCPHSLRLFIHGLT